MAYTDQHLFFDDVVVGQEWRSAKRIITEQDIFTFADLSGDRNPMHVDHEFAKQSPFGQIIAHGFGVMGMMTGLSVALPAMRTVALLRIQNWNFLNPVFVGDELQIETKILSKQVKGNGRRGEIIWKRSYVNQKKQIVQEGEVVTLVECKAMTKKEKS